MEKKAEFIAAIKSRNPFDKHDHTDLLYEYRGHQYIVTKHNNGYSFDSLSMQHKAEQKKIDEMIEKENKPIPEWKYEGSAKEGLDLFYDFIESI